MKREVDPLGRDAAENPNQDVPAGQMPGFAAGRNALPLIRRAARPLTGSAGDHDPLLDLIGDASIVFLGAASHGTHEFYRQRAQITKRLITEKGFNAVATEADWADAFRVNRYVRRENDDLDSVDALSGFERFPSWMWRNADVLDFIGWLRDHNDSVWSIDRQVGYYGLDLFSLHKSMNEIVACLERKDPADAAKARVLYGCVDRFGRDPQNYGLLSGPGISDECRARVIHQLAGLRAGEVEALMKAGSTSADESFFQNQNARLVRNAERYYRDMFRSYVSSWNQRDQQMMELLVNLIAHLQSTCGSAKVVVWAHNSHVGDARATEMAWHGELNIGQLAREAFPDQCRLVGFTTYTGSVTAASGWRLPAERKQAPPGLDGSIEKLFHQVGVPNFMLDLRKPGELREELAKARLQRAIGVVYLKESERQSHYYEACLSGQFDAVLHYDLTRAVEPLERASKWREADVPATEPAGI
jgi:erythromycin esterase-like protein